jgi:nitrate/nitrite transport system ATP-binding protein
MLLAALLESCAVCNDPRNTEFLAQMLAPSSYVNAQPEFIRRGLPAVSSDKDGKNEPLTTSIFFGHNVNIPSDSKAEWIINNLYELLGRSLARLGVQGRSAVFKNIFRTDIFARARIIRSGDARGGGLEWKSDHEALAG